MENLKFRKVEVKYFTLLRNKCSAQEKSQALLCIAAYQGLGGLNGMLTCLPNLGRIAEMFFYFYYSKQRQQVTRTKRRN